MEQLIEFIKTNKEIILWVLGALLIPGLYVFWQIREGKKIARIGRVYDKPNLEILFFDNILSDDYKTDILTDFKYDKFNSGFLEIPIRFRNSGEKSIEELEIYWKFKPNTFLPFKEGVFKGKDLSETKKYREFNSTETGIYITYKFGSIHPGVALGFGELFRLLKEEVQNGYPITITFTYKNAKPITIEFNLYVRESLNDKELEKIKAEFIFNSNIFIYKPKIIQQKDSVGSIMHIGHFDKE